MIPGGPFPGAEHPSPGDAELQTDVMRFFALLAICLVALMSLAREPAPPVPDQDAAPESPAAEPVAEAGPLPVARDVPAPRTPPARPAPAAESRPEPRPEPASPPPLPPASPSEPAQPVEPEAPLELRFASPQALERLEAAGEVGIFAIAGGTGHRWSGRLREFREAPLPKALYLMEPSTVPPALREALAAYGRAAGHTTWGVTLSPVIRARLDRRLADSPRGLLLIDAAGRVRAAEGSG